MPWRGPQYPGEFPSLGWQVAELIEDRVVVPDREAAGTPFLLSDPVLEFFVHLYRIDPVTGEFVYRRGGQIVAPQKWGKGPTTSAWIIVEAHPEGPVLPAGWDANGEPVGKPWATPWIQVTASAEDQTDNIWDALVPMIELGDLAADMPDTGRTRIYLPNGGKIEPVTSKGGTRRGQRITGAAQDETSDWTERSGGHKLADTQRRNLAGTNGRFFDTANAWDPADKSVAQMTYEQGAAHGVHCWKPSAGAGSVTNKAERRRMIRKVYGPHLKPHGWVDPDRIELEILALLERDPAQAERFFINRERSGTGAAFDDTKIAKAAVHGANPAPGRTITIGVDGAMFRDAIALVGCDCETGHKWPVGIWERPDGAGPEYKHPVHEIDGAMLEAVGEEGKPGRWHVWRIYIDPQWIDELLPIWAGRWGAERVVAWLTHRPHQAAHAVRRYTEGLGAAWTIDADAVFVQHHHHARRQKTNVKDDKGKPMHILAKAAQDSEDRIDGVMAGVLAEEARFDWIKAGSPGPPAPRSRVPRSLR